MFYSVICESNLLQYKHLGVYPINRIDRWGLSASDSVEANNTGDLLLGAAVIAIAIPEPITTVAGLIYAGIAVGATGAIIYEAVTDDEDDEPQFIDEDGNVIDFENKPDPFDDTISGTVTPSEYPGNKPGIEPTLVGTILDIIADALDYFK